MSAGERGIERLVRYRYRGQTGRARLHAEGRLEPLDGPPARRLEEVELLPPTEASKIVGVGLNYHAHAREMGKAPPEEPLLFLKPSTAVIASGQPIVRPADFERVDYEGELALVFSRRARHISEAEAWTVVAGYCCCNDVTVRDLQRRDGQYTRAKGFDTFAPLGPWLVSGLDPAGLTITTRVDGELRQRGAVADMIFALPRLIATVTRVMTMLPGDVLTTGTPPGVGQAQVGSVVEVEIEGLGVLRNPVVAEPT
ncbi:MAG: fumarylacetoacetate hydrolase family protein [Proteobacteria bacterium]|nr:fumarylacetoacetate hydrolase family protein [Pseudomonadota bacterium]